MQWPNRQHRASCWTTDSVHTVCIKGPNTRGITAMGGARKCSLSHIILETG